MGKQKKKGNQNQINAGACFIAAFLLAGQTVLAQSTKSPEPAEVIETEVTLDQMVKEKKAEPTKAMRTTASDVSRKPSSDEEKAAMINESLKNALEENKKLSDGNKGMEDELKRLRGTSEINTNRISFLTNQRETMQKRMEEVEKQNKDYQTQMERLKNTMEDKEKEFQSKLDAMQKELAGKKQEEDKMVASVLPKTSGKGAVSAEEMASLRKEAQQKMRAFETSTQKITAQVSQLNLENKKLKIDSAKLHYNLANTFFERGEYKRAAGEYQKVVEFMPNDADAHYNLAFVSGEFLKDQKTAVEHYQQYLFLNPQAEDKALVKEKILDAQLNLRSTIDSPVEKEFNKASGQPMNTISDVK